jgi:hypothetical protein
MNFHIRDIQTSSLAKTEEWCLVGYRNGQDLSNFTSGLVQFLRHSERRWMWLLEVQGECGNSTSQPLTMKESNILKTKQLIEQNGPRNTWNHEWFLGKPQSISLLLAFESMWIEENFSAAVCIHSGTERMVYLRIIAYHCSKILSGLRLPSHT